MKSGAFCIDSFAKHSSIRSDLPGAESYGIDVEPIAIRRPSKVAFRKKNQDELDKTLSALDQNDASSLFDALLAAVTHWLAVKTPRG